MKRINIFKIYWLLIIFLGFELLSYFGIIFPPLNQLVFIILSLLCLIVSFYSLEYGLLIVLGELFIGSMGHLFYLSVGDLQIPVRIALWGVLMLVFISKFVKQLIKSGRGSEYYQKIKSFPYLKIFGLLFLFISIALVNGWLRGHTLTTIFNDFNAWLYLLLLFPIVVVYGQKDEPAIKKLKVVFFAGAIWLSLKTLILLFIFTHNLNIAPDVYFWLRRTLSGEMTATLSGWPRIFIQGQIYCGIAFWLVFWLARQNFKFPRIRAKQNLISIGLGALFFSSVLISFSRSFWVGLVGVLLISLLAIWRFYSFGQMFKMLSWSIFAGALGFLLIYLVTIFPYPTPGKFQANFLDRISNGGESAITSRWSLLPVLVKEIKKEPFLGQGYGATVTYLSNDPRVLKNNPSGEYTTYAFEWGYLDLWLKLGALGLLAYLWLIAKIIIKGRRLKDTDPVRLFGLAAGLLFLIIVNIFTPYLNHPLGFGLLLLSSCLI
ncbi:MAG: hypothetical protein WC523_05250 [Patescibacteria group bacterium]|jgi:hypothetical protein